MSKQSSSSKQQRYQEHVEAARALGVPLARYARDHGLRPHVLYDARRRMQTPFMRVRTDAAPASREPLQVRLPNGVVLSLAMDLAALPQIVRALATL